MKYKYSKEKAKSILKKYELGGSIMPDLAGHMGGKFNTGKPTLSTQQLKEHALLKVVSTHQMRSQLQSQLQ
jgi:hypothetical protein